MPHASPHTRLMNMFIGLCGNDTRWPTTLRQLGYQVQSIEREISIINSTKKIAPDVIAVSKKQSHAIVADCKSGGFDDKNDQDYRYHQITPNDLFHAGIEVHDRKQLTHVACYVDSGDNHASLEPYTDLPFITFEQKIIRASGDFKDDKTTKKLRDPIPLENMLEPVTFYSFAHDDDDEFIMQPILTCLLDYVTSTKPRQYADIQTDEAMEKIYERTHPYYGVISAKHKRKIIQRIKKVIDHLVKNNEKFKEQITKIESGDRNTNTMESFANTCDGIIKDWQRQRRLTNISN